jgi:hypothetical protein
LLEGRATVVLEFAGMELNLAEEDYGGDCGLAGCEAVKAWPRALGLLLGDFG